MRVGSATPARSTPCRGRNGLPLPRRGWPAAAAVEVNCYSSGPLEVWLLNDVTEEQRLRERLELTQFAVEHAADMIYLIDESGRIQDVNDAVCHRLGYGRLQLLQMNIGRSSRSPNG